MTPAQITRNAEKIARTATLADLDAFIAGIARQDRAPHPEEQAAIARRRAEMGRGR